MNFLRRFFRIREPQKPFFEPIAHHEPPSDHVTVDATVFPVFMDIEGFSEACFVHGRAALKLPTLTYGDVESELFRRWDQRYSTPPDRAYSDEMNDFLHALLLCAGCYWTIPESFRRRLVDPDAKMGGFLVPGGEPFAKTGMCPKCNSTDLLIVYERFPRNQATRKDLDLIKQYWRYRARLWWSQNEASSPICDSCNSDLVRGEGHLYSGHLLCDRCVQKAMKGGLEDLRRNPHYYGSAMLRFVRNVKLPP